MKQLDIEIFQILLTFAVVFGIIFLINNYEISNDTNEDVKTELKCENQ